MHRCIIPDTYEDCIWALSLTKVLCYSALISVTRFFTGWTFAAFLLNCHICIFHTFLGCQSSHTNFDSVVELFSASDCLMSLHIQSTNLMQLRYVLSMQQLLLSFYKHRLFYYQLCCTNQPGLLNLICIVTLPLLHLFGMAIQRCYTDKWLCNSSWHV